MPNSSDVHRFVDTARPGIAHLQQHYRSEIGTTELETINRYFGEHPSTLTERLSDERGFCLIHGDANPTNVFVPKSGAGEPVYIIDRQPFESSLTTFLGVYDISHAIAHRWERDHRLQLEVAMLRRYHYRLVGQGIEDYSWPQVVDDYVLCAGMGIYDAVERSANGPNESLKWLWLPMLNKSIQALKDMEDKNRFFEGDH